MFNQSEVNQCLPKSIRFPLSDPPRLMILGLRRAGEGDPPPLIVDPGETVPVPERPSIP